MAIGKWTCGPLPLAFKLPTCSVLTHSTTHGVFFIEQGIVRNEGVNRHCILSISEAPLKIKNLFEGKNSTTLYKYGNRSSSHASSTGTSRDVAEF